MKSAEKATTEEKDIDDDSTNNTPKTNSALIKISGAIGTILALVISIGLFMFIPSLTIKSVDSVFSLNQFSKSILEGVFKIGIFIGYLFIISLMPDIKRTFQYHGAEHKTISCYEADCELTVENVKQFTRFHPRCGTSFLLIVLIISIIVFSVVTWDSLLIRVILKFSLLPLVTGFSYEIIQLAGRYNNVCTRIISAPGLWLQRLTTREPDEDQIEVAIAAFNEVIPKNKEDDKW